MSEHRTKDGFSHKYGPDATVDGVLKEAVEQAARNGRLPCAVALSVAEARSCPPAEVGKAADLLDFRLTKCQLGLFGYEPESKIVSAQPPDPDLRRAIENEAEDGRIACAAVWRIASQLDLGKLAVSGACEAMGLGIKPCQLGAF